MDQKWIERFHKKHRLNPDSGCWEWTASLIGRGYGQFKCAEDPKQQYAHRFSYLIHKGPVPVGKCVLHRCDNPRCVNPEHLFLGTHEDNSQDMKSKGRHLYGEKNDQAILTESDVRSIRMLCIARDLSQSRIGEMFGISQIEVSRIHRRERWSHVK